MIHLLFRGWEGARNNNKQRQIFSRCGTTTGVSRGGSERSFAPPAKVTGRVPDITPYSFAKDWSSMNPQSAAFRTHGASSGDGWERARIIGAVPVALETQAYSTEVPASSK